MEVRRQFDHSKPPVKAMSRDANGALVEISRPPVKSLQIFHTGLRAEQTWSTRQVDQGLVEGYMTINGTTLVVKADPEDLIYRINRQPGYYCRATGERIPLSEAAWRQKISGPIATIAPNEARAWLEANKQPLTIMVDGREVTNYEVINGYECVLNSSQQERFGAVLNLAGNPVAKQTMEI